MNRYGIYGAEALRRIRDEGHAGPQPISTRVMIDAKSVYSSIEATMFKAPAENSLSGHVLWLREMHSKGLINDIVWTDTRDMYADGLTKGIIKRDALVSIMDGTVGLHHKVAVSTRRSFALDGLS